MATRTIERRLRRLEAVQRMQQARSTPPCFELIFHNAEDGRDAGVAFRAWLSSEAWESDTPLD